MRRIRICWLLSRVNRAEGLAVFCRVKVGLQSQGESQETKHSVGARGWGRGFPHSSALGPDNIIARGVVKLQGFSDGREG